MDTQVETIVLGIVAASIALSAYVGTVRFRFRDHGKHNLLWTLIPPDLLFCATFIILATSLYLQHDSSDCGDWFIPIGIKIGLTAFALGVAWSIGLHVVEWCKIVFGKKKHRDLAQQACKSVTVECTDSNINLTFGGTTATLTFNAESGTINVQREPAEDAQHEGRDADDVLPQSKPPATVAGNPDAAKEGGGQV